ncbi:MULTISPECIES: hypothetical protein [unclassified Pseudomonas]|uniref:hypothetical protein n=1 Tax=unclassified Pseudomonas TaxID=196821 RepID=UPI0008713604|nr:MULTISPECIES: hypothetical protein [unclassified Pseudomonas]SCW96513.1 hypothetical protein SAMN03159481_04232 [Pseudomonas sp. NFACC56-3]SFK69095.1 hypothetical protein SAMN03159473_03376 [Pseudomonas sp. NFACC52]
MARSQKQFSRWTPREVSSWPYQVFKSHERELYRAYWAYFPTTKLIYSHLGKSAKWTDQPTDHFVFEDLHKAELFKDMKDWSNGFHEFGNWTNLNALVSLASYLETYISSIVSLAVESDVGVLYGAPKSIDGIYVLKHGNILKSNIGAHVTNCVKGDWSSRIAAYRSIFGSVPPILENSISELESMRTLRNKIGHAFGRDIEESRRKGIRRTAPMERLSFERLYKYQRLAKKIAGAIDKHLLHQHIGDFETIYFYHQLVPTLPTHVHRNSRAIDFKKALGRFGAQSIGKNFCYGLVMYYENL